MSDQGLGDVEIQKDKNNLINESAVIESTCKSPGFKRIRDRRALQLEIDFDIEMQTKKNESEHFHGVKNFHN